MEKFKLNSDELILEPEKEVIIKKFRIKDCDITWYKTKENFHGETIGKSIKIWGNNKPELAWTLAHELAHALEPEEKKVTGTGKILAGQKIIEFDDIRSGSHSFSGKHFYSAMTAEEFHASRRSKRYLKLACGLLGVSVEAAILADPPEYLKDWWDRGYYYQWRTQIDAQKKIKDKKTIKQESAKARFQKQEPIIDKDTLK